MSNTARDFSDDSGVQDVHVVVCREVAYRTYMSLYIEKEVAGEVSLTPGAVVSDWFPWRIFVARL